MQRILFILTGILLSMQAMGQTELDRRVDFSVENLLISDALLSLCEKADIGISFKSNLFENTQPISFIYQNKTVRFLLNACLKNTEIGFKWADNRLVLYQKPPPIYTISGFVEDSLSGERLVLANVYDHISGKGTTTNEYGFYSLSVPRGQADLEFSYLGFKRRKYTINIRRNLHFNVPLKSSLTLKEIIVTDKAYEIKEGLTIEDAPNFASGKVQKMPAMLGEPDILRYFTTQAGIESGSGSLGGLHIRGGDADQNLILLDGVPVYNPGHSLGLVSIFNDNIVKSAQLYKGKFPAKYGGRLSSVIDIQTKEGNDKEFSFGGAVSLFATSLFAEGPIKRDSTSFFLSLRRTHLDPLINAAVEDELAVGSTNRLGYHFYDINAKVNHTFSNKDRIYVSFYKGADKLKSVSVSSEVFNLEDEEGNFEFTIEGESNFTDINWGNTILSTRWNHIWHNKLFSNATFTYSKFGFKFFTTTESDIEDPTRFYSALTQYNFDSRIEDFALKMDFDFLPNPKHHIKFGGGILERVFQPIFQFQEIELEDFDFDFGDGFIELDTVAETPKYFATELNFYLEDEITLTPKLTAEFGFHNAVFTAANSAWISFQPRLSLTYQIHPKGNLYTSFGRMAQFLHVLSPAGVSMPFDLWVPSTQKVKPQNANQLILGTDWQLPANFTFGTEAYYKKLNNLITYRAGVEAILMGSGANFDWENEVTFGEGWNYGIETSLKRTEGKASGFINYAWSRADRRFDGLNNDQRFPFRYHREHSLKIGLLQEFGPKFSIFASWTYGSGQFTTPRVIEVYGDGTNVDIFQLDLEGNNGAINNVQLPPKHHLDLTFNFHWPKKRVDHYFTFGINNVYNNRTVLFPVRFVDIEDPNISEITEIRGLPVLPSLRYSLKF